MIFIFLFRIARNQKAGQALHQVHPMPSKQLRIRVYQYSRKITRIERILESMKKMINVKKHHRNWLKNVLT